MIINKFPKTYGRKRGRKKKFIIDSYSKKLKEYSFNKKIIKKNIIIEIGSGNGENAINLSRIYLKNLIIACDVYIDGHISLINKIIKYNIDNILIYNKNCYYLFDNLPKKSVDEIWILYPDPWPKKKHYKRRLINDNFLLLINNILKSNGKIYISTDDRDYFIDILLKIQKSTLFIWDNWHPCTWSKPFKNMTNTAFFNRANKIGRKSYFMIFKKKI